MKTFKILLCIAFLACIFFLSATSSAHYSHSTPVTSATLDTVVQGVVLSYDSAGNCILRKADTVTLPDSIIHNPK